jgi:hypothetical protein
MTTATVLDDRPTRRAQLLLTCGVVGPPLFVVALLVEGATRPGYSTWRNAGSQLSTGPWGWTQITNFILCGLLVAAAAVGLRQVLRAQGGRGSNWGPVLVGSFGLSLVVAGGFVTDPGLGYPPGTPLRAGGPTTWHGLVHGLNGLVAFGSLTAASFVFARRYAAQPGARAGARCSLVNGIVQLVLFFGSIPLGNLVENGTLTNPPIGLLQRIQIATGWAWLALVALRELRTLPGASAAQHPAPEPKLSA